MVLNVFNHFKSIPISYWLFDFKLTPLDQIIAQRKSIWYDILVSAHLKNKSNDEV